MIDVESINELHVSTVARWHREPIDNPYGDPTASTDCVLPVVCQQHQFNYLLWHEEDIARSPDVSDAQIARVKRNIDKYNQARNDWIEKVDDWITESLQAKHVSLQTAVRRGCSQLLNSAEFRMDTVRGNRRKALPFGWVRASSPAPKRNGQCSAKSETCQGTRQEWPPISERFSEAGCKAAPSRTVQF